MAKQRSDGWLAGTYDDGWVPTASYACLTGVAQMSLNWMRLAQISGDKSYRDAAWRAIAYLKTHPAAGRRRSRRARRHRRLGADLGRATRASSSPTGRPSSSPMR